MTTETWPPLKAGDGRRPLIVRQGAFVLFVLYISLLAGRFSLERLSNEQTNAFSLDLRWVLLISTGLAVLSWYAGLVKTTMKRDRLIGITPFALWCAWTVFSAIWAPRGADVQSAGIDMLFMFCFIAMAWFVMSHLDNDSVERVWTWVLVTGLVYFALALISGPDTQGRFAAPGGGPNTFVRIMLVSAIAALYLINVRSQKWLVVIVPIFITGAILSGSRGGLLSAVIICILFIIPIIRLIRARTLILLAGFGSIAVYVASLWRDGYIVSMFQERFIEQTLIEGHTSGRGIIVEQAWDMFLQRPIVGVGLNGFDYLESGPVEYGYAHNLFLSALAETGIVGALILSVSLLYLVLLSMRKLPLGNSVYALMAGLFFLGSSMFSGDYYDSRFVWFFLAMAVTSAVREYTDNYRHLLRGGGGRLARVVRDYR